MAADTAKSAAQPPAAEVVVSPVQARCLRCNHDLSHLPDAARFCPRCGLDVLGSPPASMLPYEADQNRRMSGLLGGWEHLFHIFRASGQSGVTQASSPDATSKVVQGYGNALYRLGRRYEFGGAITNPREALRCYSKSARLGNFWAMARLASHVFATRSDATPADAPAAQPLPDASAPILRSGPVDLPPAEPTAH
jgi:TPR repeat protein